MILFKQLNAAVRTIKDQTMLFRTMSLWSCDLIFNLCLLKIATHCSLISNQQFHGVFLRSYITYLENIVSSRVETAWLSAHEFLWKYSCNAILISHCPNTINYGLFDYSLPGCIFEYLFARVHSWPVCNKPLNSDYYTLFSVKQTNAPFIVQFRYADKLIHRR